MNKLTCLVLGTLFFASCGETEEVLQPVVGNGETVAVTKDIHINVLPMQRVGGASTRGGEVTREPGSAFTMTYGEGATTRVQTGTSPKDEAESAINNAYILQFDGTSATSELKAAKSISAEELNGTSPITCDFVMTAGVKNRVYVVANLTAEQIAAITGEGDEVTPEDAEATPFTLSAFETPVTLVAPVSEALPASGLPMSSYQDIGVGDSFDVFQLKSLLAKLTFTCQTDGATLKLKGVPNGYSFNTPEPGDKAVRPAGVIYDENRAEGEEVTEEVLTSGATYYVAENLSGAVRLSSPLVRCSTFAPGESLFVEIAANATTYNLYLGDGSVSDFNFVGGYAYNVNATIYGTDVLDLRVGTPEITGLGNAANCYIVTDAAKWYSFNGTVMGNGASTPLPVNMSVGVAYPIIPQSLNPGKADVLWETVNTAVAPAAGSIVNGAVYVANGQILFRSGDTAEGNAVIAARDASNNILWSWHIWRTNTNPTVAPQTLAELTASDGTFDATGNTKLSGLQILDRNLGALSATVESDLSAGLFYQFGRKDPFPGSVALSGTSFIATTNIGNWNQEGVTMKKSIVSVSEAVSNPTVFYATGADWTSRNDNLWGTALTGVVTISSNKFNSNGGSKSIYDPCPSGWRTAPGYAFANAVKTSFTKGYSFSILTSGSSWYPASGFRNNITGTLGAAGAGGYCRASTPVVGNPAYGSILSFNSSNVKPADYSLRSYGNAVRCAKE